jgi:DNA polymerase/3'-5' exonuclease PolX
MKLETARQIGMHIVRALTPACNRIAIAGSVRRGKANPKDLELVYIPRLQEEQINLLDRAIVPVTDNTVATLIRTRYLALDAVVRRNGNRYKRLVVPPTSPWHPGPDEIDPSVNDGQIVVDLFRADESNWGYIYALRTGPGDFNALWARKPWHGGCCPIEIKLQGGNLWRNGQTVPVPEEEDFFREMGLPHWPPHERSAIALSKWMLDQVSPRNRE